MEGRREGGREGGKEGGKEGGRGLGLRLLPSFIHIYHYTLVKYSCMCYSILMNIHEPAIQMGFSTRLLKRMTEFWRHWY